MCFSSCVVPSGGEDGPEAAAGVCGVHRVQRRPARKGRQCGGREER